MNNKILVSAFLLMIIFSCKKQDLQPSIQSDASIKNPVSGFADNDMVLFWNDKASIAVNVPNTPHACTRSFAIIQIAVHDALNAIKPKFERFAMTNERSQFAHPDAAVAAAAYWAIKGLGLQGNLPLEDWFDQSLATIPDGESKESGKQLGRKAADAVIQKRSSDNFAEANMQIALPDGVYPGEYRSTLPFSLPGMPRIKALHQWGTKMLPFVIQSNAQFRPGPPDPVHSAAYTADYNEVKLKGGMVGHTRTADESEIGIFWVERSYLGWNRFARNLLAARKMDAWKTARLFALMHTAMIDLASANFEAKYHYFYWRPETAIRLGEDDGNPHTAGDPNWLPGNTEGPNLANPALNVYTPPIPDYPSFHAGSGGAAAEILRLVFGTDNVAVNQTSTTLPGVTRFYSNISQAERDNSLSRLYVGYHFRKACLVGEEQGRQVAKYVFDHSFRELD